MEPLALDLSRVVSFSDDDLFQLCVANRDLRIERTADGTLEATSPTGGKTRNINSDLVAELVLWNRREGLGLVFDSSAGFLLSTGAMRAPDVAWVARERWERLSHREREAFPPLCPDFVIELRSPSDWLPALNKKMLEWMDNGCRMAWLIDPVDEQAVVYRPGSEAVVVPFDGQLDGADVLTGFTLELATLR